MAVGRMADAQRPLPCVLVVGGGRWGGVHLRTWATLQAEGLVGELALVEPDGGRREQLVEEHGATGFAHLDEGLLWSPTVATVASPTDLHVVHGLALLAVGADVLVEKPVAVDAAQVATLCDVAEATGRTLLVGHLMRFHAGVQWLVGAEGAARVGGIRRLSSVGSSHRPPRPDMGVLWAKGVHDLDVMVHLLGRAPDRLRATIERTEGAAHEHAARVELAWSMGAGEVGAEMTGEVEVAWLPGEGQTVRTLEVEGEEAVVSLDIARPEHVSLRSHGGEVQRLTIDGSRPPLEAQFRDLVRRHAARLRGSPEAPAPDDARWGVLSARLIGLALASAAGGGAWIAVPAADAGAPLVVIAVR